MKLSKKIILCLCLLTTVAVSFSDNSGFNKSCTYLFAWDKSNPYNSSLAYNKDKRVRELTNYFCTQVQSFKCSDSNDWSYSTDYFDASQSIFLSILCNSVWAWEGYVQVNSYLKKKDFIDFGILSSSTWYQEDCYGLDAYWSMNNCNYSYNLPLIFNKIMNDFFSIKQARNFWITGIVEEFKSEERANTFSLENFPWLSIALGENGRQSEGICDPNNKYYKTTCKKLKWYMIDANNLLINTEIVDVEKLQASAPTTPNNCDNDSKNNILYCWLLWSNSDYKFVNAVYNEYFRYKIFLSYYSYYINWTDYLDDTSSDVSNLVDKLEENKEKIFLVQDQLLKSKQAITLSLQSLWEMSYSFPLHIGFLMYHEDAKFFMENLAKLYAPIRTLYDKLRNVEIKEE